MVSDGYVENIWGGVMKTTSYGWIFSAVALLLVSGAAFAQAPQSSPAAMRGLRLRGGMPFSQLGATPAHASEAGGQPPEVPALSLTWGIYTFPGSVGSYVAGVNKAGHIVGDYGPGLYPPYNGPMHGFLLKSNKFTSFDYPGAVATEPQGINDSGEIVGGWLDTSGYGHSFQLKSGIFTTIDLPEATPLSPPGSTRQETSSVLGAQTISITPVTVTYIPRASLRPLITRALFALTLLASTTQAISRDTTCSL